MYGEDGDAAQVGQRFETSFEAGKSYRLRLVNVAMDSFFKFMIDNHTLTVIAADFVPIEPYTTDTLSIAIGQRYDVIVTADQSSVATDFWMRAIPQSSCSDNDNADNIRGIVHYGVSTGAPSTTGYSYTDECADETNLIPMVSKDVAAATFSTSEAVSVGSNANNYFEWTLNSTSYLVAWEEPVSRPQLPHPQNIHVQEC